MNNMTKTIKNKSMFYLASDIVKHVKNYYALPSKLTYDGITYYILEYVYIVSYGVFHLKSDFKIPNFKWIDNKGEEVNIKATQEEYKKAAKWVYNYIINNGKVPTYVTIKGKEVPIKLYVYGLATTLQYYHNHGDLPGACYFDYHIFYKPQPKPQKSRSEKILDEFESYFGVCKYIDDALEAIQGRGYAFYFSDGYNMSETIRRVYNRQGANCYDIAEVLYHCALGMNTKYGRNYEVQYLDVWCPVSGYDHIRLRLRNGSDGDWFYRDGACVLDGGDITDNWCGTYNNILEVNPSWIMDG